MRPQDPRRHGPRSGAGARCLPVPTAAHVATAWPAARRHGRHLDAIRAHSRCTGNGAESPPARSASHPNGSCAGLRITLSRDTPSQPHRRHHYWSGPTTRQASTARSGSSRCPVTSRPRSSSRQTVLRSGQARVTSGTSRSPGWTTSASILGRPRPLHRERRSSTDYTLDCEEPDLAMGTPAAEVAVSTVAGIGAAALLPEEVAAATVITAGTVAAVGAGWAYNHMAPLKYREQINHPWKEVKNGASKAVDGATNWAQDTAGSAKNGVADA